MKASNRSKILKTAGTIIISLITIIVVVFLVIYFFPVTRKSLQTGTVQSVSYEEALKRVDFADENETAKSVTNACNSKVLTHGTKTARAVVMFHGVTACPEQFDGLAKTFYDAGYNVYIPLTPYHGTADKKAHGQVTAQDLVDYVNTSVTTTTGLGDEIGVVGLSGGGMLSTWAAEYRPEVKHALLLSPFYEPAVAQAAKWKLPLLRVLYGYHILPDTFVKPATPDGAAFSYRALANYLIVTKNLKSNPTNLNLKSIGLVTSADDDQIDLPLANKIPEIIASKNNLKLQSTTLPADWKIGHDNVNLDNKNVAAHQDYLYPLYLSHYEGK